MSCSPIDGRPGVARVQSRGLLVRRRPIQYSGLITMYLIVLLTRQSSKGGGSVDEVWGVSM